MFVVVIGTSIWMAYESNERRIPIDGKPYGTNNGAFAWLLSGLLLWIATFPYYLIKRSQAAQSRAAAPASPPKSGLTLAQELASLTELHASGKLSDGDYERAKSKLLA